MSKKKPFKYTKEQEAWLKDLETPRTKQGTAALHTIDEEGKHAYCCLGRACVVLRKLGYAIDKKKWEGMFGVRIMSYDGLSGFLTSRLRKVLHIRKSGQRLLSILNDDGTTFKEIAAEIRKHPRKYFYKGKV